MKLFEEIFCSEVPDDGSRDSELANEKLLMEAHSRADAPKSDTAGKTSFQQRDGTVISETVMQDKSTVVEVQRGGEGKLVQRKNANGDESYVVQYAADGHTIVRLQTRGNAAWESPDGRNWYKQGRMPGKIDWPKDPEWKGSVRIEDGNLIQTSASGRHQCIQQPDGSSLKITKHEKASVSDKRLIDGSREIEATGPNGEKSYTIKFVKNDFAKLGTTAVYVSEGKQAYVSQDGGNWFKAEKAPPLHSTWPEEPDSMAVLTYDEDTGSLVEVSDRTGIKSSRRPDGRLELVYTLADFRAQSLFMFDHLEFERNDYLSSKELYAAPKLVPLTKTIEQAQMLAVFRKHVDEIKMLSDDQFLWETEIHRKDIEKLNELVRTFTRGGKLTEQERRLVKAIAVTLKEVADEYR